MHAVIHVVRKLSFSWGLEILFVNKSARLLYAFVLDLCITWKKFSDVKLFLLFFLIILVTSRNLKTILWRFNLIHQTHAIWSIYAYYIFDIVTNWKLHSILNGKLMKKKALLYTSSLEEVVRGARVVVPLRCHLYIDTDKLAIKL